MEKWDYQLPWYHGSPQELDTLRAGSSITQQRDIARIFSHRPSLVSQFDDGNIKHDGTTPGYLYVIAETIHPDDIIPHPHPVNASRWEWLTTRALQVQLLEHTQVRPEEQLREAEIITLKHKQQARGESTFREESSL